MYDLYLNDYRDLDEACHLGQANSRVRAMHYHPGAGDGLTVTDRVELVIEGLYDDFDWLIEGIERRLEQAARGYGLPQGGDIQLWAQVSRDDSAVWHSRVLGGRVSLGAAGADQRPNGVQALIVEIRREDYWENSQLRQARLANGSGDNQAGPLVLHNHRDAAHWNSLAYSAPNLGPGDLLGSLPVGGVLTWQPLNPPHPQALTVLIGHGCRPNIAELVDTYPAAAWRPVAGGGVSASSAADPTCAGGQYLQLDWTGSAEAALMSLNVEGADGAILGGGPARMVVRLAESLSGAPAEKLWYRWRISALEDGVPYLAGESSSQYMETNQQLVIGPLINLPPWLVDATVGSAPALRLELVAQAAGDGAHTLKIDTVTILPCDGWRIYRPITGKPTYGLVEHQPHGAVLGTDGMQTHTIEGPGFTILPQAAQRWWVFVIQHEADGQKTAPVDLQSTLAVEFYSRRRTV